MQNKVLDGMRQNFERGKIYLMVCGASRFNAIRPNIYHNSQLPRRQQVYLQNDAEDSDRSFT